MFPKHPLARRLWLRHSTEPLPPPGGPDGSRAQAPVQVITAGGMPGWQIALIALGAAVLAAGAAVLTYRAQTAGQRVTPSAA